MELQRGDRRARGGGLLHPLISAVGHETDFTLIDLAADRRAPTPPAAAEMAVPVRSELVAAVDAFGGRLAAGTLRHLESTRRELRAAARMLPTAETLLSLPRRMFDELAARSGLALLANARVHRTQFERAGGRLSISGLTRALERARERLAAIGERKAIAMARRTERLGRAPRLAGETARRGFLQEHPRRGFALVTTDGEPVRSAAAVPRGKALDIEFGDGHVAGGVERADRASAAPAARGPDDGSQGSLL